MMKNKRLGGKSADAILLMFIKLVTIMLGFVITRLLSQYLSVYDYGTYSQILLIVSTVSSMTILGMMDGINYFYCSQQDPQRRDAYIATIFALQCIVSAAAGLAVLLLSKPICQYFGNPELLGLLVFAALLPFLQNLLSLFQILLVSVGRARMLAVRNLLVSLAKLAAALTVVLVARNVAVMLAVTLVMDIVQILFFGSFLRREGVSLKSETVDFSLWKTIFSYCAPMAVFTAINTLNRDLDKYLITLMTDTETLAIYANASRVLPFDIVMTSFCTVLIPEITRFVSNRELEKAAGLYRTFLEIAYVSTGIMCCAALSAAPQLMQLLYSSKYVAGLRIFCIYILVDLIRFTNMTLILSAAGKTRTIMLLGMASIGVNAVLNVLLYRLVGMEGPAVATLISTLMTGGLMLRFGSRELNTRLRDLFDGKYLVRFVLENLTAVAVFTGIQRVLASWGVHYVLVLLLVGGGYGLLMLALHGKRLLLSLKNVNRQTGGN